MYVYIYTYAYIYVYIYMYADVYVCVYICMKCMSADHQTSDHTLFLDALFNTADGFVFAYMHVCSQHGHSQLHDPACAH